MLKKKRKKVRGPRIGCCGYRWPVHDNYPGPHAESLGFWVFFFGSKNLIKIDTLFLQ